MASTAHAQWVTETFALDNGWNSVFVTVDPANDHADQVFVTTPADAIERVWTWEASRPTTGESALSAEWRVWLPASNPSSAVNTLVTVTGGRVYLIKTNQSTTLTITGTPNGSKTDWVNGSNVAGLYIDGSAPPTFDTYFAPSDAHSSTTVFGLQTSGSLASIATNTAASKNVGYWISTSNETTYSGPIEISSNALRGLDYNNAGVELQVGLTNLADAQKTITLEGVDSASAPAEPGVEPVAGTLPLKLRSFASSGQQPYTLDTVDSSTSQTVQLSAAGATNDGEQQVLQISVDRTAAAVARGSIGNNSGGTYQSLVRIRDGSGFERILPVSAVVESLAGLYAGIVVVNQVAWIQADARIVTDPDPDSGFEDSTVVDSDEGQGADVTTPRPTPAAFTFPVIVHYDGVSAYTFLSEVTLLYEPDPNDTADPGRFILATPSCGAPCAALTPGSLLDGELFRRRVSTVNFSFVNDLAMTGNFGSSLTVPTLTIDPNDPLNPFLHRYNPDHDGDRPGEVLTVTRDISFDFTCPPQAGEFPKPGQGDAFLTGCYSETLSGLHQRNINVAGFFELSRISRIETLNDVGPGTLASIAQDQN